MNKKSVIDYLLIISIFSFLIGICINNKLLNVISFLIFLFGILIKDINKDTDKISPQNKKITKCQIKKPEKKSGLDKIQYFKEYMINWLQEDNNLFNEEYSCFINNCCPNCGCVLDKRIVSSKKCPECKEKIILRTNRLTSKKLLMSENIVNEYDTHDKKRSEIIYFENIISKRQYVYKDYMNKFYELKSNSTDPRNVVYPFVNYVGSQLDNKAYKEYMRIINLPEKDMALESFNVIRMFELANMEYFMLGEIANYKGRKDIALNTFSTVTYRGVQISILDSIANPYHEMKTIDVVGNIYPGAILKFLKESGYSFDDFKNNFLQNRHPFILEQLSNEESWSYVYNAIKLYKDMESKR